MTPRCVAMTQRPAVSIETGNTALERISAGARRGDYPNFEKQNLDSTPYTCELYSPSLLAAVTPPDAHAFATTASRPERAVLKMHTAIIGLGNIGSQLARNLTAGGEAVILADKSLEKAQKLAALLGGKASAVSVVEGIRKADVIILAVYFDASKQLIARYRGEFAGKVVVDPSNPIAPDGRGGFKKIIPTDQSAGQLIAADLPGDAELVKAFGTLAAESLGRGVNRSPDRAVLFYATDFPEAGRAIEKLIRASGFTAVSVGGIQQSIRIEVGGDLHELGKLGRLVTAQEAATLV